MSDLLPHQVKALDDFLESEARARAGGHTAENHTRALGRVADKLEAHERECREYRKANDDRHDSIDERVRQMEAINRRRRGAAAVEVADREETLPPMREELSSSHNLEKFAEKVAQAAIQGLQAADSSPEEATRKVVLEEEKKREEARELATLRQAAADRIAEDARRASEAAQAREDRIKFWRTLILTALGGGSAMTGIVEAVRALVHH